jgi:Arc/MetJ-type ribon-helix-helix transcriptional regulator
MIYHHTGRCDMTRSKVAITIDERLLARLDRLVRRAVFRNRSQAIQEAVKEKLERLDQSRLARECSKLDPGFEKALAEEGLSEELGRWPQY